MSSGDVRDNDGTPYSDIMREISRPLDYSQLVTPPDKPETYSDQQQLHGQTPRVGVPTSPQRSTSFLQRPNTSATLGCTETITGRQSLRDFARTPGLSFLSRSDVSCVGIVKRAH
jgi:hypothetical protein